MISMPCKGPDRTTIRPRSVGQICTPALPARRRQSKVLELGIQQFEMAAGHRGGNGIGAGLDAVGDQMVTGDVQGVHALHQDPMCSVALECGLPWPPGRAQGRRPRDRVRR